MLDHEYYMKCAIKLAKISLLENEVPIGCIIVKNNKIISSGRNKIEKKKTALYHAEIEAINNACKNLKNWRLLNCSLYVTLEPCLMCAGAILNSRISNVYIGTLDKKNGAAISVFKAFNTKNKFIPQYSYGYLEDKCSLLIKNFFKKIRKKNGADDGI